MNYYIECGAAKAGQIKAAFERLGYDTRVNGWNFNSDRGVYFTNEADKSVDYTSIETFVNLIKTNYKKLELPVEHEFKVGDWVVRKDGETFYGGNYAEQITLIEIDEKGKCIWFSSKTWTCEDDIRPWTIADAKDGDVLVDEDTNTIGIFEKIYGICWHSKIYCSKSTYNTMVYSQGGSHEIKFTKPATKEQRDLLFAKMREAGYEWDAGKKELRKIIEPKFKVGDWVVYNEANVYQVKEIDNNGTIPRYKLESIDGIGLSVPFTSVYGLKKWTITDAKNGDVLVDVYGNISIYEKCDDFDWIYYCSLGHNGGFQHFKIEHENEKKYPATKEQRDLLFKKMKEAGYQWDADKKELRKIQPHYDIANFQPFDKVLVRQNDSCTWGVSFFGLYSGLFMCCTNVWFEQCIPFNEKTKHLLGTTDMCPDEYINW